MSWSDHRFDTGKQYGARSSERRDERGGGRGGSGGKMRWSDNESRRYDDREPCGGMRARDDRGDSRDGGPRGGYGGQSGGMKQRERDRDDQRRHDGQWQQDYDEEWRHSMYTHDGRGGGSGRRHGDPRYEYRGNGGGVSFSMETQGPARVGFRVGGSSMEHPDAERERGRRRRQAEEEERAAAAHREQSAPGPARRERGQTQGDVWTGPIPQGASDDAVRVQRERIGELLARAKTTGQGLFGLLNDDLMGQVWHFVEEDEWTYKGVLSAVKEQPRLWMTLDDLATTTLGALRKCAGRTMQTHSVGRLVRRAATYGWLPRLARDIDEEVGAQRYVEILDEFRMIVRRRDIGDVSKRADKVMNHFDSILRPGMAARFSRAAPAIALLREAVERGWKLKLARDVAAMAGTAVDSDDDDDLPNMS